MYIKAPGRSRKALSRRRKRGSPAEPGTGPGEARGRDVVDAEGAVCRLDPGVAEVVDAREEFGIGGKPETEREVDLREGGQGKLVLVVVELGGHGPCAQGAGEPAPGMPREAERCRPARDLGQR